jgi:hypothetical protein
MAAVRLLKDATTTATGLPLVSTGVSPISFQASVAGTGAVTATVIIEGTNEKAVAASSFLTIGTITLSGTTSDSDGFVASAAPWDVVRARCTAISGTNATLNVYAGHK